MTGPPDWTSLRGIARILKVSTASAGKLAKAGRLHARRLPGLSVQFNTSSALKLAESCERKPDDHTQDGGRHG